MSAGFSGAYYGGDGTADTAFNGRENMIATRPASASGTLSERALAFNALCDAVAECAGGVYTAEMFDAMIVLGYSIFAQAGSPSVPLTSMIQVVGQGFVGAPVTSPSCLMEMYLETVTVLEHSIVLAHLTVDS